MTTVAEALQPYISANPITQRSRIRRLQDDLNSDPALSALCWVLEQTHYDLYIQYHPHNILQECEKYQIKLLSDLVTWSSSHNIETLKMTKAILDPPVALKDSLTDISAVEIRRSIESVANLETNCVWRWQDPVYRSPTLADLQHILSVCPSNKFKYVRTRRDCEDFARIFRGWLSEKGLGDLTIGAVEFNGYKDGKFIFAHAVLIAITSDNGIFLVEPQNDKMWRPDEVEPGFTVQTDENKIRFLMF